MLTSAVTLVPFWILPRSLRPTGQWFERDFIRLSLILLILISIFFLGIWYLSYRRASATYLANILPGPPLNVLLPLSVAPNPKSEVKGLEAQLSLLINGAMRLFCVPPHLPFPLEPKL